GVPEGACSPLTLTGAQHGPEFSQDVGTFTAAGENTRNNHDCRSEKGSACSLTLLARLTRRDFELELKAPRHVLGVGQSLIGSPFLFGDVPQRSRPARVPQ